MALSKFSRKLSERISLKLKNIRKCKWVHVFSEQRLTFGEFYHPCRDTRVRPDKVKDCLRMSKEIFDTLLKRLELRLCGPGTNYKESIYAEVKQFIYRKSVILIYKHLQ
jgi:hypothetical protein